MRGLAIQQQQQDRRARTVAALVAVRACARDELLLGERKQLASGDLVNALSGASSGECPA